MCCECGLCHTASCKDYRPDVCGFPAPRSLGVGAQSLRWFAMAAITKYRRLGGLNNRGVFSHISGAEV